jgi:hypothetical protein
MRRRQLHDGLLGTPRYWRMIGLLGFDRDEYWHGQIEPAYELRIETESGRFVEGRPQPDTDGN